MIDYSRKGQRVKIIHYLRTAYRTFRGHEQGVIVCELNNNCNHTLVEVQWDEGEQSPVFLEEIIFLDEHRHDA